MMVVALVSTVLVSVAKGALKPVGSAEPASSRAPAPTPAGPAPAGKPPPASNPPPPGNPPPAPKPGAPNSPAGTSGGATGNPDDPFAAIKQAQSGIEFKPKPPGTKIKL